MFVATLDVYRISSYDAGNILLKEFPNNLRMIHEFRNFIMKIDNRFYGLKLSSFVDRGCRFNWITSKNYDFDDSRSTIYEACRRHEIPKILSVNKMELIFNDTALPNFRRYSEAVRSNQKDHYIPGDSYYIDGRRFADNKIGEKKAIEYMMSSGLKEDDANLYLLLIETESPKFNFGG
ncbi:MAG: hypothetical protein PHF63_00550 [Herbinix sp.]|nr:hypothetical protein [Herbinix sp.]